MKNNLVGLVVIGAAVLFIGSPVFAADPVHPRKDGTAKVNWEKAVKNYIRALHSESVGVRRSAVYFFGEYKLKESVDPLIEVLGKDKTEQVRMAAALVLVNIGDASGIKAVADASVYDGSEEVAKFCGSLLAATQEKLSYNK